MQPTAVPMVKKIFLNDTDFLEIPHIYGQQRGNVASIYLPAYYKRGDREDIER